MNAATRLGAFGAVVAVAFGGAALTGAAVGPDAPVALAGGGHGGDGSHAQTTATSPGAAEAGGQGGATGSQVRATNPDLGGLAVSSGGYTLELERPHRQATSREPLRFKIVDAGGKVVRDGFDVEHEKKLHFIVVRRDTAVFKHLHPSRSADGTWTVAANIADAGVYRAYADFVIDGTKHTLGTDVFVPGQFEPQPFPAPAPTTAAVAENGRPDRLDVAVRAPGVRAGRESRLTFSVARDGQPLNRLQPYLGAKGHLVALRGGDLGYLHVHPLQGGAEHEHDAGTTSREAHANEISFSATFPTPGTYRVFLQFKTGGAVRTVANTIEVPR